MTFYDWEHKPKFVISGGFGSRRFGIMHEKDHIRVYSYWDDREEKLHKDLKKSYDQFCMLCVHVNFSVEHAYTSS